MMLDAGCWMLDRTWWVEAVALTAGGSRGSPPGWARLTHVHSYREMPLAVRFQVYFVFGFYLSCIHSGDPDGI